MRIACDIDGVVADCGPVLLKYIGRINPNIKKVEDIVHWDLEKLGVSPKQMYGILRHFEQTKEFSKMNPIEDAVEGVNRLVSNYEFYFITARDYYSGVFEETKNWLVDNKFGFNDLFCDRDKLKIIKEKNIEWMIEDSPPNIKELVSAGIKCICFDQHWNQEVKENSLIKRCKNWKEIETYFQLNF